MIRFLWFGFLAWSAFIIAQNWRLWHLVPVPVGDDNDWEWEHMLLGDVHLTTLTILPFRWGCRRAHHCGSHHMGRVLGIEDGLKTLKQNQQRTLAMANTIQCPRIGQQLDAYDINAATRALDHWT